MDSDTKTNDPLSKTGTPSTTDQTGKTTENNLNQPQAAGVTNTPTIPDHQESNDSPPAKSAESVDPLSFNQPAQSSQTFPQVPGLKEQDNSQDLGVDQKQEDLSQGPDNQGLNQEVPPPPQEKSPGPVVAKKGGSFFKIFIIFSLIVILLIWGYVGYLYLENQRLKDDSSINVTTSEELPNPTPTPISFKYEIENGNVVKVGPDLISEIIIDKSNYPETGLGGFYKVKASPDNMYLCVESYPPAKKPGIYISDSGGQNVELISESKRNCVWSQDSNMIAYNNTKIINSPVDIFLYDLTTKTEENLTDQLNNTALESVNDYQINSFTQGDTLISCSYEKLVDDISTSFACEINIQTKELQTI